MRSCNVEIITCVFNHMQVLLKKKIFIDINGCTSLGSLKVILGPDTQSTFIKLINCWLVKSFSKSQKSILIDAIFGMKNKGNDAVDGVW